MKPLAQRPTTIRRSGIRELMELAGQMQGVIHLEVGEPDSNTAEHIIEAAAQAAHAGFTRYTPTAGLRSLREALARKVRERNGLDVTPDQIIATPGAGFAVTISLLSTLEAGEEALVPDPCWPNYLSALHLIGATAVPYTLLRKTEYLPDLAELRRLVTPRTKVLLINTPGNPTGAVFPGEMVQALVEFAAEHDLYLISDEVYEEFVFEGEHVPAATFDRDGRVITVFGFSKTYAMTGWRLGYVVASPQIAPLLARVAEPLVSCPSSLSQKAAEAALQGPQDQVARQREAYRARRDAAVRILGPAGLLAAVPHGAFYALVDVSSISDDSAALARQLLQEQRVATAPGDTFGRQGVGLLRLSLATEQSLLEEGCRRIVQFVQQHRRIPVEVAPRV
ncbi:MAG: aminotransferase class I/II-fold pyridoxal phosphate-dependent enzyme [Chloroflexi bacterium]|nr:aminotransferase class I/II-fold pyridoxal phosphate-dependent enzyme [Chloroflexota bacterium]